MILYVALGGVAGTLARYLLGGWVQQQSGSSFPIQTLVINISGSFLVGLIARLATGTTIVTPEMRAALTVGFCGAYTTMSTFSYESIQLLNDGQYLRAALYGGSTILGCFAATFGGIVLAARLL
jgi:CrcB protein